jgi:HSP20 family protein
MTIVRRPSPLGELVSLRQAMDRLFEDSFVRPRTLGFGFDAGATLPLDITDTADALLIDAALPGFKPEDVDVTVENGTLTIRAESRDERESKQGEAVVREIRRGSVNRTVTLPTGLESDKATATFENGVLQLRIPRAEAVKPRQIRITPTVDGNATHATDTAAGEPVAETQEA